MNAWLIAPTGEVTRLDFDADAENSLTWLQGQVGGLIQAVRVPTTASEPEATCYVNEEGETLGLQPNIAAYDLLLGVISFSQIVLGPALVVGFDPRTGEHVALDRPPYKLRSILRDRGATVREAVA